LPKLYANVKVPQELIEEVDKLVKNRILGYRSRAELIMEAIREKINEINNMGKST